MKSDVLIKKIAEIISTWFWVGKIRKAPGTWGTLAATPLVLLLNLAGPMIYMFFTIVFIYVGVFAADIHERTLGTHDSGEIVIDEVVGYLIAMTWLPMTWQALAIGFVIFRILDIFKPFPIGWLDKKVSGGLGVMLDDVAAGVISSIIMQVIYSKTNWLGAQIIYFNS